MLCHEKTSFFFFFFPPSSRFLYSLSLSQKNIPVLGIKWQTLCGNHRLPDKLDQKKKTFNDSSLIQWSSWYFVYTTSMIRHHGFASCLGKQNGLLLTRKERSDRLWNQFRKLLPTLEIWKTYRQISYYRNKILGIHCEILWPTNIFQHWDKWIF